MQNKKFFKMRRAVSSYNRLSKKLNNISKNNNNNDEEKFENTIIPERSLFNNFPEYSLKHKNQISKKKMYDELWNKNENKKNNSLSEAIQIQNKHNCNKFKKRIYSAKGTITTQRGIQSSLSYHDIGYCSKRKIKSIFNSTNFSNSIITLSKNQSGFNVSKNKNEIYYSIENKEDNKNYEISLVNYSNADKLRLRTDYLIKFSKINEYYKKMEQITDCFRVDLREKYSENLKVLIKYFDTCNNFLLNDLKENEGISSDIWGAVILCVYNFCLQTAKLQKFFYDEMHYMKNDNLFLKQKFNSQEIELNSKNKDITEVNKYIVKYDLTNKIKFGKQKELKIEKIKTQFENKESFYVMTIYKLQEEIKNLHEVLEKYKGDESNKSNLKQKYKNLNDEFQNEKDMLISSYNQKHHDWRLLIQRINSLSDKLSDVETENSKYKEKEMDMQNNRIQLEAKIKNLNNILNEKNNEIDNLKEENQIIKNKLESQGKLPPPANTVFVPY